jgi:hypothetical protein
LSPSSPKPISIDLFGFEFGFTIHVGMEWDRLLLPHEFALIVDGQEPHMHRTACGRRRDWHVICGGVHDIEVGHFVIIKYDGTDMLTVKVFEETPCTVSTNTPRG